MGSTPRTWSVSSNASNPSRTRKHTPKTMSSASTVSSATHLRGGLANAALQPQAFSSMISGSANSVSAKSVSETSTCFSARSSRPQVVNIKNCSGKALERKRTASDTGHSATVIASSKGELTPRHKSYQGFMHRDVAKQVGEKIGKPRRNLRMGPREHPNGGLLSGFVEIPMMDLSTFDDAAGKPTWIQTPRKKAMVKSEDSPTQCPGKQQFPDSRKNSFTNMDDRDLRFETCESDSRAGAPRSLNITKRPYFSDQVPVSQSVTNSFTGSGASERSMPTLRDHTESWGHAAGNTSKGPPGLDRILYADDVNIGEIPRSGRIAKPPGSPTPSHIFTPRERGKKCFVEQPMGNMSHCVQRVVFGRNIDSRGVDVHELHLHRGAAGKSSNDLGWLQLHSEGCMTTMHDRPSRTVSECSVYPASNRDQAWGASCASSLRSMSVDNSCHSGSVRQYIQSRHQFTPVRRSSSLG